MEYNFFEPFLKDSKSEKKTSAKSSGGNNLIYIAAMVLVVGLVGASFGYTLVEKSKLNKEIAEIDAYFADESIKVQIAEVDAKLAEIADIKLKQQYLQYLEQDMKNIDIVNDRLLDFIKKEVVKDLTIETLNINKGKVELQGLSLKKLGIAQFEYDLRNSGNFYEVFVPSIQKQDSYFKFDMNFDTVVGG
ncbi:MAG: PilN domain-containing protein [Peptostreptococcaceae bacterium]|nr:PilN domain-containing protein [Peptostreptococcaceae bacterium]